MRAYRMLVMLVLAGCPGGSGALGDRCGDTGDCTSELQCLASTCVARCQRGPDCGDGYTCTASGICQLGTGQPGETCGSETTCAPGLSCQLDGTAKGDDGLLLAACTGQNVGVPAGSACEQDSQCRNGTCALGHCVDLCVETHDCPITSTCQHIPRLDDRTHRTTLGTFGGCLPASGILQWSIDIQTPQASVPLPVPDGVKSVSLLFSVDDRTQLVGATHILAPDGTTQFLACTASQPCTDPVEAYYANKIRHAPAAGTSLLEIPSWPSFPLQGGVYQLDVSSLRADLAPGSAIPKLTVIAKLDASSTLDLHFHFLDLSDHMCAASIGPGTLTAATAQDSTFFTSDYLGYLKTILTHGGLALGTVTYDDIKQHPDLDGLDINDVGSLFALGSYATGINVFFVRTLAPAGIEAYGPNPGPALAKTALSGIVVAVDTLCYRSWKDTARLTAHELARYMGLFHNVEAEAGRRDLIDDTDDSSGNLMFYSELGNGVELSEGQRSILAKSPVLR